MKGMCMQNKKVVMKGQYLQKKDDHEGKYTEDLLKKKEKSMKNVSQKEKICIQT